MSQPSQKPFEINAKVKTTAIKAGKYVGLKLLKWGALLLVLAIAWWYFFGSSGGNSGSGTKSNTPVLQDSPSGTVRAVYNYASAGVSDKACMFFSVEGAEQFARNMNAVNCLQAMDDVTKQVQDPISYSGPTIPKQAVLTSGSKSEISSCAMAIAGGPKLGAFLMQRQPDGGWQITGHESEPADCITG
ncbi:hypothetical protein NLX83_06570 [Allokutzneria sp. A3M-2-11 16]|uniref:hypothetical protein n=1 Tax=Allokutzneria sp. A3M-2-11 16 TaxID=2962043 RepID=UPI0020B8A41A|nr:hypothetical protein [Allokutzneria sp. A3M-2-11 16]MCP3798918.1 hypothetical protein [Allokutzneria sp. A3M-2-11 16]